MLNKTVQPIFLLIALSCLLLFTQCNMSSQKEKVRIGFSQCTMDDVWRVQMLQEMKRESALLNDVEFQIILKDAENDSEKQENDIRNLVKNGIDILIVSPNQRAPLKNIIDSVVQLNIPVILIDRDIKSELPTYFIGASNYNIGKMAGQKAISLLPNGGNILVFAGLRGSAPAIQRQKGFRSALVDYDNYQIKPVRCDWTEETAYTLMTNGIDSLNAELIYAHNDFMARGVIKALQEAKIELPPIIGIDGLNMPGCGIDMVLDSLMAATITYPTGGDIAIQTAYKILNNQDVQSNIWLNSILITSENVRSIKLQRNEIEEQYSKIDRQNQILSNKDEELFTKKRQLKRAILTLSISLIVLFVLLYFVVITIKARIKILRIKAEAEKQMKIPVLAEAKDAEKKFITDIEKLVKSNLTHKDLSIQFVGDKLAMSHSTVYRKIKKTTGLTGVELIKLIRIHHAVNLLKTTNLSIEDIAFQTGFNTASYFSTSFVKQFGVSPAKFRKD